jgi:hypothetical protein
VIPRLLLLAALASPSPATELAVLAPEHPKAFFFRTSEGVARAGKVSFERWNEEYSRLHGIIGKCLDEEIPGTMKNNPAWFTRFKKEHPEQVVLLHFNGNANDPLFETEHWFPGHWIHRAATTITRDVPAEAGATVIHIENSRDFKTGTGRYRNINDDIALFGVTPDGKHDWSHCEQVRLLAIDHEKHTITVRRGCYGTMPLGFAAKQSRAAAHQVEGPWGINNHLLWFYNFTDHCPRDPNGNTAAEVLVDRFAAWFGPGGPLEALDGVEFDVMHHVTHGDTTGDGLPDHGIIDGRNRFGTGMVEFARGLRRRMGPDFIIQGDGALGPGGLRSQRAFRILNGIESEGFPNLRDWDFDDWSGGLNRHKFWSENAHPPAFSYINHKWIEPVAGEPGRTRHPKVPFARHRLAFAAAIFTDSVITYAFAPNRDEKRRIGVWDELVAGTGNRKAWLGKPKGPAVHLATREPNLVEGLLPGRIGGMVETKRLQQGAIVRPRHGPASTALRFSITDVPTKGPDLLVTVKMRGEHPAHWPDEMARSARVGVNSGIRPLLPHAPELTGMRLRGRPAQALDPETGASVRSIRTLEIGDRSLPALQVHPPYRGTKGSTHWAADVELSRDSDLRFSLGMGPLSPERSDGVGFEVHVAELTGGQPGKFERVFRHNTNRHQWLDQSVGLGKWTGKQLRLKFVADCGPRDNATTDHAFWGAVRLVPAGCREEQLTQPKSHMTWLNGEPFTSTFYFRDIRSKTVDLDFEIEHCLPVSIHSVTAHPAPDLMMREFEHGLVLANPSRHKQTFDLEKLLPGQSFRRIQGKPEQDPDTNNGQPVGKTITLGERDAIFLQR